MRNKLIFIFLFFILTVSIVLPAFSQQETITITTYYPAPFGVYRQLRLFPVADNAPADPNDPFPCTANDEGAIYYDASTNSIKVCSVDDLGNPAWGSSGLWRLGGSGDKHYLYPNRTNWNVGIGTATPLGKLTVMGGAFKIANTNTIIPGSMYTAVSDETADYDEEFVISMHGDINGDGTLDSTEHGDDRSSIFIGPNSHTGQVGRIELNANKINVTGNMGIGIGQADPQAKLDVNGGVRVGNDTADPCNAGTVRYNGTQLQVCNGGNWENVGNKTALAVREDDSTITAIYGPNSAFVAKNNIKGFPNIGSATLDGIGCNEEDGWRIIGCWSSSSRADSDTVVGEDGNSCVTNDFDQATSRLFVVCLK